MRWVLIILVLSSLVLAGCIQSSVKSSPSKPSESFNKTSVVDKCVLLCREAREKGLDLSKGPCLSNDLAPGWVCDVAHWPRQEIDNNPANQCPAYGKTAHAFVEVDPSCKPIRAWDGTRILEFQ